MATAQKPWDHGPIVPKGHYLQHTDGTPFFWLGDTGWELFHRLTMAETERYLANRSAKGFNVIQAVLLAEFDGLRKPDQYGQVPLHNMNPTTPNEAYFKRVDSIVQMAAAKNLYIGLLPTWGDKVTKMWGTGPEVFTPENAYTYGLYLGKRYAGAPNVLWILGGDRPAVTDSADFRPLWRQMARGILEGTANKAFITYHISGGASTSAHLHSEPWLHMNMMQSGHGSGPDVPVWEWVQRDRALLPAKPVIDAEPNYEDHPVSPWPKWDPANGYYSDYDVRKQSYRSVFAGAAGVTYGHHAVWQFYNPREEKVNHVDRFWTEAIDRPGATQVGYLRRLMESRPMNSRVPDQALIAEGQGAKGEHAVAFHDSAGTYAMIYFPVGKPVAINIATLKAAPKKAWWFNPRNGKTETGKFTTKGKLLRTTPPTTGRKEDWVLVLDVADYKAPGR